MLRTLRPWARTGLARKPVQAWSRPNSTVITPRKPVTVDVELPDVMKEKRQIRASFVAFCITMAVSFCAIVKYEEASAPVVSSTLYTLRRSPQAREILGSEINFATALPWISGKLQAGRGVVDFSYEAIGERSRATVHFAASKDPVTKKYVVRSWSLTTPDGVEHSLMDEQFQPFIPGAREEPTSRRVA